MFEAKAKITIYFRGSIKHNLEDEFEKFKQFVENKSNIQPEYMFKIGTIESKTEEKAMNPKTKELTVMASLDDLSETIQYITTTNFISEYDELISVLQVLHKWKLANLQIPCSIEVLLNKLQIPLYIRHDGIMPPHTYYHVGAVKSEDQSLIEKLNLAVFGDGDI